MDHTSKASTRRRGWHLRRERREMAETAACSRPRSGIECVSMKWKIIERIEVLCDDGNNNISGRVHHRDVVMTLWIANLIYSWSISFSFPARKTVSSERERKRRWSDMKIGSFISSCNSIFCADDSRWWSERENCLKLQQHVFAISFCPHESDNILITNFFVSIFLH